MAAIPARARLSDAERIHRLELVIDLLLDLMIADEIARHPPRVAQQQAQMARRGHDEREEKVRRLND